MKAIFSGPRLALLVVMITSGAGTLPLFAQKADIGADFILGLPQNEFRDNVRENGYGLSGHFGSFIQDSPVMIGLDVGYLNYGREKRHELLSDTIPDVIVEVRNTNNILMLHGFLRLQQQRGPVRPYVEGLWGFKYLFTRTTVEDDSFGYERRIASATNISDFAGSWGLGAGVDFRVWRGRGSRRSAGAAVDLNLSARYLWGSEAEYLRKGSIRRDPNGLLTYDVLRSKTDLLVSSAGIRFRF